MSYEEPIQDHEVPPVTPGLKGKGKGRFFALPVLASVLVTMVVIGGVLFLALRGEKKKAAVTVNPVALTGVTDNFSKPLETRVLPTTWGRTDYSYAGASYPVFYLLTVGSERAVASAGEALSSASWSRLLPGVLVLQRIDESTAQKDALDTAAERKLAYASRQDHIYAGLPAGTVPVLGTSVSLFADPSTGDYRTGLLVNHTTSPNQVYRTYFATSTKLEPGADLTKLVMAF